jgi:hypothetical protein
VEEDGSKRLIASFTQLRSSLPVLWAAPPDLAPDPAVSMCTEAGTQQAAVKAHVQQLKESYQVGRGPACKPLGDGSHSNGHRSGSIPHPNACTWDYDARTDCSTMPCHACSLLCCSTCPLPATLLRA